MFEIKISHRRLTLSLLFLSLFFNGFTQARYLPECDCILIEYTHYFVGFNKEHRQANWVYHELSSDKIESKAKRKNNFRVDNNYKHISSTVDDYKNSGYDRGHLCPAGDMCFCPNAMSETFYMTNMSPQVPKFNRGIWKKLEDHVRKRAKEEFLYVVTGPVFKDNIEYIGKNNITVPGYFYKVIYSPEKQQMIGYVIPNAGSDKPINHYAVPVKKVETLTGIDFFPQLPEHVQKVLEADTCCHQGIIITPDTYYTTPRQKEIICIVAIIFLYILIRWILKKNGIKTKKRKTVKRLKPTTKTRKK